MKKAARNASSMVDLPLSFGSTTMFRPSVKPEILVAFRNFRKFSISMLRILSVIPESPARNVST